MCVTLDSYPVSHVTFACDPYVVRVVYERVYTPCRIVGMEPQSEKEKKTTTLVGLLFQLTLQML